MTDPEQVIVIDETHKDKRASRRRRAWGKRNSGGIALKRYFMKDVRYTMIAGFNLDGFVDSTIVFFYVMQFRTKVQLEQLMVVNLLSG